MICWFNMNDWISVLYSYLDDRAFYAARKSKKGTHSNYLYHIWTELCFGTSYLVWNSQQILSGVWNEIWIGKKVGHLSFNQNRKTRTHTNANIIMKHCQRHNGPEGWVHLIKVTSWGHITSSNTNLDQIHLQNLD